MSDTLGYSQLTPNSSANEFNSIAFMVSQMIARLDTMKLVQVVAVTGGAGAIEAAGTVDVMPLVNQVDGGGFSTPHGIVPGIPWSRSQGGPNAVIIDPEVGDIGWVVASDRDISAVKKNKKASNPGSFRKFDVSDGVYAGGCLNVAPTQYLVFTAEGVRLVDKNGNSVAMSEAGTVVTDSNGNVLNMSSSGVSITPKSGQPVTVNGKLVVNGDSEVTGTQKLDGNLQLGGTIESAAGGVYGGSIEVAGDVTAGVGTGDQVTLKGHLHVYARPSGASAPANTSAPNAGT